jgi:hypothetical protein
MAETGSFELAQVDVPSGACGLSPMQWAEAQGVGEVTEMLLALRNQNRSKFARASGPQIPPAPSQPHFPHGSGSNEYSSDSPSSGPASVIAPQAVTRCFTQPTTKQSQSPSSVPPPMCG